VLESIPSPPEGTKTAGRRLWKSVLSDFELEEHEQVLLVQAVRVADLCEDLQAVVDQEGPLLSVDGLPRTHPAVIELRQQRLVLARLIVALRVPLGDEGQQHSSTKHGAQRLQRRSTRGFYAIAGVWGEAPGADDIPARGGFAVAAVPVPTRGMVGGWSVASVP
jgi:hypothetical protein